MIIILTGASHTGKTALSQKILETYHISYLSVDHLKMGLIRSSNTSLTAADDNELTSYLWNITKEIIKTAIENNQNLTVEGCYIPLNWKQYFSRDYLEHIRFYCLIMTEKYIDNHFSQIKQYSSIIETRLDDTYSTRDYLVESNNKNLAGCKQFNCPYILFDDHYHIDMNLFRNEQ